jgi:hypothetical protein
MIQRQPPDGLRRILPSDRFFSAAWRQPRYAERAGQKSFASTDLLILACRVFSSISG